MQKFYSAYFRYFRLFYTHFFYVYDVILLFPDKC